MVEPCLFCRIVRGEIPAPIVAREADWLCFRDLHPQAPTHLLIIPTAHVAGLNDLDHHHAAVVARMVGAARHLAESEGCRDSGYRLVINCGALAGQSVFHLHLHLLGGRALNWPPG